MLRFAFSTRSDVSSRSNSANRSDCLTCELRKVASSVNTSDDACVNDTAFDPGRDDAGVVDEDESPECDAADVGRLAPIARLRPELETVEERFNLRGAIEEVEDELESEEADGVDEVRLGKPDFVADKLGRILLADEVESGVAVDGRFNIDEEDDDTIVGAAVGAIVGDAGTAAESAPSVDPFGNEMLGLREGGLLALPVTPTGTPFFGKLFFFCAPGNGDHAVATVLVAPSEDTFFLGAGEPLTPAEEEAPVELELDGFELVSRAVKEPLLDFLACNPVVGVAPKPAVGNFNRDIEVRAVLEPEVVVAAVGSLLRLVLEPVADPDDPLDVVDDDDDDVILLRCFATVALFAVAGGGDEDGECEGEVCGFNSDSAGGGEGEEDATGALASIDSTDTIRLG